MDCRRYISGLRRSGAADPRSSVGLSAHLGAIPVFLHQSGRVRGVSESMQKDSGLYSQI